MGVLSDFHRVTRAEEGGERGKNGTKRRFCAAFLAFFASIRSFLSTPNFQKSTPNFQKALTFESEKVPNFEKSSLTTYYSII
ncbi:MAG: hypothetical protein IJ243_05830 [Prevotella sp.]|nr:hypothetical protein [Prevotella sp.]